MNIAIEKNIPMPKPKNENLSILIQMKVGDSIFIPNCKTEKCKLYESAKKMKNRKGLSFSGRNENGGVRIWRIE